MLNTTKKCSLLAVGAMSLLMLGGCQINLGQPDSNSKMHHQQMHKSKGHHSDERKYSSHHRMHEHRHAAFAAMQKACVGQTVGSTTAVQFKDQSLSGQCELVFKPQPLSKEQRAALKNQPKSDSPRTMLKKDEPLTDAKRAEMVKQYEQRLIERQAKQTALTNACKGQSDGKALTIQFGKQQQQGTCQLMFKPDFSTLTKTNG